MLKKGFMLVELLLAAVLLGVIVVTAGVYGKYIGIMNAEIDRAAIVSMAKLGSGMEYMVQRMLHTDKQIPDNDGRGVTFVVVYGGGKRTARIYFDKANNQMLYDYNIEDDKPAKVFLTDIIDVTFTKDAIAKGEERLAIEIEAAHKPYPVKLRTSLIGRNRPIPQGKIN